MPIGDIKVPVKVEFKWWAAVLMTVLPPFFEITRIKPNSKRWLALIQGHGLKVTVLK